MTDQPPPPSEKKPRRRSAPRKRAPAKRAAGKESAVIADATAGGANAGDEAVSSEGAVAAALDPAPLADAGDRGDAPATDLSLAPEGVAAAAPTVKRGHGEKARDAREPSAPAPTSTARSESTPDERSAERIAPQSVPEARAAKPAAEPFPRQAELRPGELIRVPLSVRWRDLDAFNHVNNSKYLSYLEEARLRWMLAMPGMGMDDDVAPVVAASNLNYRRPIEWPGDIVIELFVERIGGSSLTIGHRIVDSKDGGTLYCDGNIVMVWIDRNSGRSAPLPESVRAACR
jgi:YbgC/YbaW family acyl-CoA thioester hydrolase